MVRVFAPVFSAPAVKQPANQPVQRSIRFGSHEDNQGNTQPVHQNTVELTHPHHSLEESETTTVTMAQDLFRAIKTGHADAVQTKLTAGANPNLRDRLFYTALHRAVDLGNPSIVSWLLKKGADPNAKSPLFSAPPIHQNPNDPRGQKVLQVGGDPSTMSPVTQETPLDRALHHHKLNVIPALILGGAELTDTQRPRVHEALKQLYKTQNLSECLENAFRDLDVRKARVLLSVGIHNEKLPTLYPNLLNIALDNALRKNVEGQGEYLHRRRQYFNAIELMNLLTEHAPNYTTLAPAIAENKHMLFPSINHKATAKL